MRNQLIKYKHFIYIGGLILGVSILVVGQLLSSSILDKFGLLSVILGYSIIVATFIISYSILDKEEDLENDK